MIKSVSVGLAALVVLLAAFAVTPAFAQIKLGGTGAPQAVNCANKGGTMNGTMCDLPSGRSCEAMTYAREGQCFDASGNLVPEVPLEEEEKEEDVGDNQPASPDPSNGTDSGDADTPTQ